MRAQAAVCDERLGRDVEDRHRCVDVDSGRAAEAAADGDRVDRLARGRVDACVARDGPVEAVLDPRLGVLLDVLDVDSGANASGAAIRERAREPEHRRGVRGRNGEARARPSEGDIPVDVGQRVVDLDVDVCRARDPRTRAAAPANGNQRQILSLCRRDGQAGAAVRLDVSRRRSRRRRGRGGRSR